MEHSRDVIFDESSVLERVSSLSPEEDTTHEPTVLADSDDTPTVSDTDLLPPLPSLLSSYAGSSYSGGLTSS